MSAQTFTIVQLYPEQLGSSGDGGNVIALAERARRSGVEVETVGFRPGDPLPATADLVLIGSGPLSALRALQPDALRWRERIAELANAGVPVIAIGGGAELLSREIVPESGEPLEGLGFFAARALRGAPRRTNYFRVDAHYADAEFELIGFEDHATRFQLDSDATALGRVQSGGGNGDGFEGIVRGASFGTQLKGPLLPLNPALSDRILTVALSRIGVDYRTNEAHARLDEYAEKSRQVIVDNLERHFKAI